MRDIHELEGRLGSLSHRCVGYGPETVCGLKKTTYPSFSYESLTTREEAEHLERSVKDSQPLCSRCWP